MQQHLVCIIKVLWLESRVSCPWWCLLSMVRGCWSVNYQSIDAKIYVMFLEIFHHIYNSEFVFLKGRVTQSVGLKVTKERKKVK